MPSSWRKEDSKEVVETGGEAGSRAEARSRVGKKAVYKCYHCGLEGHLKRNYKKLLREHKPQGNQLKKDGEIIITFIGEMVLCSTQEEKWCLKIFGTGDSVTWLKNDCLLWQGKSISLFTNMLC